MMKKLLVSIMTLCIFFCCVSCSTDNVTDTNPHLSEKKQINEDMSHERPEPPCVLVFDSFEKIAELKSMLEEDNDTVVDYLDNNNYYMNGLTSKNDIANLFNDIGGLNMFHMDPSSGYSIDSILYYLSYNYIMSTYSNGHDCIRFICYIGPSDEKNTLNKTDIIESDIVGNLYIGNKKIELSKTKEENSPYALVGKTQTANSRINIFLFEDNEEAIRDTLSKNIVSSTLLNLIEK